MIRPSDKLDALERRFAREHLAEMSFQDALAVFSALWREATVLRPDFPGDWRDDLEADFAIARAINGLPPRS